MNMVSEVERIIRAVLKDGGSIHVKLGNEENEPVWKLVGVENGNPRIEFDSDTVKISMNASTLEGEVK